MSKSQYYEQRKEFRISRKHNLDVISLQKPKLTQESQEKEFFDLWKLSGNSLFKHSIVAEPSANSDRQEF